jgi:MFS family permease
MLHQPAAGIDDPYVPPDDVAAAMRPDSRSRVPSTRRNLIGWLLGLSASLCADEVFFLALTFAAIQVGSAGQVGVIVAIASLPRLAILFFGGALSDRVPAKVLMVSADTARAIVLVAAAAAFLLTSIPVWGLVVISLIIGALDGFFLPAALSLPARIAPPHLMGRAAAMRTAVNRIILIVGGPLTGLLIAWRGPSVAFLVAGLVFAVSVLCLGLIKVRAGPPMQVNPASAADGVEPVPAAGNRGRRGPKTWCSPFAQSLKAVRRNPAIAWLVLLATAVNLGFVGPVFVGVPLLAVDRDWGASGAGVLIGSFGAGAAVSATALVFLRRVPRAGPAILASVLTMGLTLILIALTPSFGLILVAAFVLGASSGVLSSLTHGLILSDTPHADLGRVVGLVAFCLEGALPLSYILAGFVTDAVNAGATFVGGGVIIIVAGLAAGTRRSVWQLEQARFEQPNPDWLARQRRQS